MPGEEQLPEERRVGTSESLKGRRSEEMTKLNTSPSRESEVTSEFQRGWWQLKSPRIKRFLEEEKMDG